MAAADDDDMQGTAAGLSTTMGGGEPPLMGAGSVQQVRVWLRVIVRVCLLVQEKC